MSTSELSLHSNDDVSEALQQLKLRLHAVKEDCDRYATLERQAQRTFEDHRRDLTQLRQKERALHTEAEDELQAAVDGTRREVQQLREQAVEARRAHEAALYAELQEVRASREERAAAMEAEVDHLAADWRRHQTQVYAAEQQRAAASRDLAAELEAQVQLQEHLREVKARLLQEEEEEEAAAGEALSMSSPGCSPARRRCRRGRPCEGLLGRQPFLPNGPVDRVRPLSPASHHVQAMVATVQRRNYYRPRTYLQRQGCDVDYRRSPLRAQREAMEAEEHERARARRAPPSPARDPPLLVDQPHTGCCCSSSSHRNNKNQEKDRNRHYPPHPHTLYPSSFSSFRERGAARVAGGGGDSMNEALRLLLLELAELQQHYYECKAELTDPHGGDALEVSRDMRRTLAAMDRKAEQVRVLRRQQQQLEALRGGPGGAAAASPLLLHEVLAEIVEENRFCAAVYEDLLQLLRAR